MKVYILNCVFRQGQALTEDEIECLVLEHEHAEDFLCDKKLVEAMTVLEDIVER